MRREEGPTREGNGSWVHRLADSRPSRIRAQPNEQNQAALIHVFFFFCLPDHKREYRSLFRRGSD